MNTSNRKVEIGILSRHFVWEVLLQESDDVSLLVPSTRVVAPSQVRETGEERRERGADKATCLSSEAGKNPSSWTVLRI